MAKGKKLNILHTESMGTMSGQPKRVIDELRIVQELGHSAHLACRPDTWLEEEAHRHGIAVLQVPLLRAVDPTSFIKIAQYIYREKIDIVHSHNAKDSYSAWAASRLFRIPFVRGRHSNLVKRPGPLYSFADRIVTTGNKIKKDLVNYGIDEEKILSLPSYPDPTIFSPDEKRRKTLRNALDIEEEAIVIGGMGGFKSGKRSLTILKAMAKLKEKHPNIYFLLAGPETHLDYKEEFMEFLAKENLDRHFHYMGYSDPAQFLDAIDIYLCPSIREGVPQALMQAMMMGKACISTGVGGIPDLNIENNLILIEPDRIEELTHALEDLLIHPDKRRQLGTLNRKLSLRYFNRDILKRELGTLYDTLVSKR